MQALRFLLSRWVLSFLGIVILAVLVWLFGPLIPSFESWVPRLAIVIGLLLTWATSNLSLDLLHRRREQKLESGVAEKAPEKVDDGTGEEAAALRERMSTALTLLKKARGTRGYLYEQPWYAIIGPPGAGKTTALLNSGLKFPLAAEMGQGAVAGVGGTRLCDWWFTENAVLIDTAGRYTTQDSNAAVDRAGWDSFLDLLRRTRPRQPLNGVIVAIALSDIADAPPAERAAHAAAIRRRIKELESRLGIRMPVYALFTKADLIAGFTEFFDDLDRDRRNQVWGVTFPLVKAEAGPVGQFPDELQLLVDSLNDRLFDRLQAEQSPERRVLIAGFPTQIATLAQPLQSFLVEAFGGSRLDPAPLLRGVYFTSGTQEGTPIDRLTGVMARAFGLDQRRAAALRPQQGRSYFLGRLVSQVILGEAMLVSEPPAARARRIAIRAASYAAVGLLTLGAVGWLIAGRSAGQREIAEMSSAFATYEAIAKETTFDPVNDSDLPRLLPLLDAARNLGQTAGGGGGGILAGFDLSQSRQAPRRRRHGLSPCPGLCAAAAPGLAAGSADARLLHPARFPLRGDARLPDAGRPRAARSGAGQGMDDLRLADPVCRCRQHGGGGQTCRSISMRSWRSPCRRCRWTMRWSRRRAPPSAAFHWHRAPTRASSRRRPPRTCRRGSRATCWGRRASGSSPGPRARS